MATAPYGVVMMELVSIYFSSNNKRRTNKARILVYYNTLKQTSLRKRGNQRSIGQTRNVVHSANCSIDRNRCLLADQSMIFSCSRGDRTES